MKKTKILFIFFTLILCCSFSSFSEVNDYPILVVKDIPFSYTDEETGNLIEDIEFEITVTGAVLGDKQGLVTRSLTEFELRDMGIEIYSPFDTEVGQLYTDYKELDDGMIELSKNISNKKEKISLEDFKEKYRIQNDVTVLAVVDGGKIIVNYSKLSRNKIKNGVELSYRFPRMKFLDKGRKVIASLAGDYEVIGNKPGISQLKLDDPSWDSNDYALYLPYLYGCEGNKNVLIWVVSESKAQELIKKQEEMEIELEKHKAENIEKIDYRVNAGNRDVSVVGYDINISSGLFRIGTALAGGSVGSVDSLEDIAKSKDALIAVNGSYFGAYSDDKDPYGILVVNGKPVHNANDRATFAFKNDKMDIDFVDTYIKGYNGEPQWKYSWNGYWLNHTVIENGESLIVYTPERGAETRSLLGTNYIIKDGVIDSIVENTSVAIPKNGYVVNLYGNLGPDVYERFSVGRPFDFDVTFKPERGSEELWNSLDGAVGAGPALMVDGQIQIDFEKEHFSEAKIKSMSTARSAVGYTKDGHMIVINCTATIGELAEIMKNLGCYEAMNLDGGASSGLYKKGELYRNPGRKISNILYVE